MRKLPQLIILTIIAFVATAGAQNPPPPPPPAAVGGIAQGPAGSWQEFNNETGNFMVMMPDKPVEITQTVESEIGKVPIRMFVAQDRMMAYMAMYADYPVALDTPSVVKASLDNGRDMMLSQRNGKLISEKEISYDRFAGRDLQAKISDGVMRLRMFIVHQRLYVLTVIVLGGNDTKRLESKEVNRFLDSFRLIKEPPAAPASAPPISKAESAIAGINLPPEFFTRPISWREVASPEFGFTIWMPSEPHREKIPINPNDPRLDIQLWMARGEDVLYQVMVQPMLAAPRDEAHHKILFRSLLEGMIGNNQAKLLDEAPISFEGYPGREYKLNMLGGRTTVKAYIIGANIFALFVMPMAGNEKPPETSRFFSSLRLTKTPDAAPLMGAPSAVATSWREFSYPEYGFKSLLPGEPKIESSVSNGVASNFLLSGGDGLVCMVMHQRLPMEFPTESQRESFFKSFISGFAKNAHVEASDETRIVFEGHPGREYKLKQESNTGRARVVMADRDVYTVVALPVLPGVDPKAISGFFDSFKLIEKKPSEAPPPPPPPPAPAPASTASSSKKINVSGGVLQGSATKKVQPDYPPIAKAASVEGLVRVQVTVSEEGRVIDAEVIDGHPLLRDAALDAAKRWEFNPTTLEGKPVKIQGVLTFSFTLTK
jgi:TonB family protein